METELMNTFNMTDEDGLDFEEAVYETKGVLKRAVANYEKRYKTTVGGYLLLAHRSSWYGSIGGNGLTGGHYVNSLEGLFNTSSDDMRVYLDDDGLHFDYYDHDGVNACTLKLITDSTLDGQDSAYDAQGFTYDQTIDYLLEKKAYTKGTNKQVFAKALA